MEMKCICCGKTFKYGWQVKEKVGVCEECIKPVEMYLSNANVELNDLKNVNIFEETKNKLVSDLNSEKDKETIEYLTAFLDRIYNAVTSKIADNQNFLPLNLNDDINMSTVKNSNSSGMFSNIGSKIKNLAQVVTWIGIIACVVWGLVLMVTDEELIFVGLMIALLGSLISWVSSFVLYGFGQLIENTDKLVENLKK